MFRGLRDGRARSTTYVGQLVREVLKFRVEKRKVGRDVVGGVALLANDVFGVGEGCHAKNETISTDSVEYISLSVFSTHAWSLLFLLFKVS